MHMLSCKAAESLDYLNYKAKEVLGVKTKKVANVILENRDFHFWSGSASSSHHHYGESGLLIHTAEVVEFAITMMETYHRRTGNEIYLDWVFLAALHHDVAKMLDYAPVIPGVFSEWQSTDHKRKVHHISRSGLIWMQNSVELPPLDREEIYHAILAHHGSREYGSPVTPATPLAWLIHIADAASARLDESFKGIDILNR